MQGQVEWMRGRWLSKSAMGTALHRDTWGLLAGWFLYPLCSNDGSSGVLVLVVSSACEPGEVVPLSLNLVFSLMWGLVFLIRV